MRRPRLDGQITVDLNDLDVDIISFMTREYQRNERYAMTVRVPLHGAIDSDEDVSGLSVIETQIEMDPRLGRLLISENCVQKRTFALARQIIADYKGSTFELLPVLTGAFMFTADLARALYRLGVLDLRFYFMKLSTYQSDIKSREEKVRAVRTQLEPGDLEGKDIIIVEDIVDQGYTLKYLREMLLVEKKVASVRVCSLLVKELNDPPPAVAAIRSSLTIDYAGFSIPDVWVAGYGIDAANEFRHIPYIVVVNEDFYR